MSFDNIKGQDQVVKQLQYGLKNKRISHAYCFSGPEGAEKELVAWNFAKALNCEEEEIDACDQCRTCRQIEHRNHPDVRELEPDGTTIKIGQVRQLKQEFSRRATEGFTRILIIRHAETMTLQAANSLLKFLEEPITPMVAILITDHLHGMLPTIYSRCQPVRFVTVHPLQRKKQLLKLGVTEQKCLILAQMDVQIETALQLSQLESFDLFCELVIQWSEKVFAGKNEALIEITTKLLSAMTDEKETLWMLDILFLWFREILNQQLGRTEHLVFFSWEEERRRQAKYWTPHKVAQAMENILLARQQLMGPVPSQSILEYMVLAMQEGSLDVRSRRRPLSRSRKDLLF
ncbi:DNA polymerase III subunit delta' [Mechercharimyces sp. CAU 1602]|uniref:DNA polymerase III subunit delta' n=1 Tax=Mechercharimyces sp. CAU 1602 TaxID=2973933 RepID=UPI002162E42B|nr:DNA polymerase III subunit delta' [Mechercharimyces sp. CAU 1602]MCS1352357.1 DNA polymerase III subunit delta' [Mechercharimyces sp. CAU 1602]